MPLLDIFSRSDEKNEKEIKKPKIIVDIREKNSLIVSALIHEGCQIEFKQLSIGDYIIKNTIIERKTVSDFISSMINKRLNNQLNNLKTKENKILLIEGIDEQELYHAENRINENAIRGYILSILLNYRVPILITKNYEDSAKFIKILALKTDKKREISINDKPRPKNINEQLQYLVEGFPGIGPKTARKLLKEFKTFKNIINAEQKEIENIIGKKKDSLKIINKDYTKIN